MKFDRVVGWLDKLLSPEKFDDVSNNGIQIANSGKDVRLVAFAVDASLKSVREAVAAKADLLVVHHGISWGGGIRRLTGADYAIVRAAIEGDLALYASHLPLDANKRCGNNWELARYLNLSKVSPAFNYHGNTIGIVGYNAHGKKIGVCSGGAGEMAVEAKSLGCDLFVTGEANWGERIAAQNVSMPMICAGHYETETFGVKAVQREMKRTLKLKTVFVGSGE